MSRIKMGKWDFTEEELSRQLKEAATRGQEAQRAEPRASRVSYDGAHRRLLIELSSGVLLGIPVNKIQGLANAAPRDLEQVKLEGSGDAVRWDALDLDLGIPGLVAGVLGTNAWMVELGRMGGSVQSKAKAIAARANGLKGGRPAAISAAKALRVYATTAFDDLMFAEMKLANIKVSNFTPLEFVKFETAAINAYHHSSALAQAAFHAGLHASLLGDISIRQIVTTGANFHKSPEIQVLGKEAANNEELALAA